METKIEVLRAKVTPRQRKMFEEEIGRRGLTISDAIRQAIDNWIMEGKKQYYIEEWCRHLDELGIKRQDLESEIQRIIALEK